MNHYAWKNNRLRICEVTLIKRRNEIDYEFYMTNSPDQTDYAVVLNNSCQRGSCNTYLVLYYKLTLTSVIIINNITRSCYST